MKYLIVYLIANVSLIGCIPKEGPDCHKSIGVINNSSLDIWVYQGLSCSTTLNEMVRSNSTKDKVVNQPLRGGCFEKDINNKHFGGKLDVYIFSIDPWTMKNNCDTIKLKTFLLERRSLTVAELEKNNWVITYPK